MHLLISYIVPTHFKALLAGKLRLFKCSQLQGQQCLTAALNLGNTSLQGGGKKNVHKKFQGRLKIWKNQLRTITFIVLGTPWSRKFWEFSRRCFGVLSHAHPASTVSGDACEQHLGMQWCLLSPVLG